MNSIGLDIPVVFIIFNRPDETQRVFERIREARPKVLCIVADGPRTDRPLDLELCQKTLNAISHIDWPCKVIKDISQTNLGCQKRIYTGITKVLEEFDECIILEDDCLPDPSFFQYCAELLVKYRHDNDVMVISGNNFVSDTMRSNTYYFSRFNHLWGWATWKKSWSLMDYEMTDWPELKKTDFLKNIWPEEKDASYWQKIFDSAFEQKVNSWGYRWTYSCWKNRGLSILPCTNLVTNIGFGANATHTIDSNSPWIRPNGKMEFPIKHPSEKVIDYNADLKTQRTLFSPSFYQRVKNRILKALS